MNREEIIRAVRQLPDEEIKPLLNEVRAYYDGEVWDRQIEHDQKTIGVDEFSRALGADMANAGGRRQAALRLVNSMRFSSAQHREQVMADLAIVLGENLK